MRTKKVFFYCLFYPLILSGKRISMIYSNK
nr:MAG TPA: hypothetical protein [Caudoviricetes sp.]